MKNVQIVHMDNHFLYLPFYHASQNDYFNLLPKGYTVQSPHRPSSRPTDEAALYDLLENESCDIAICDPMYVLDYPIIRGNKRKPVILAALVVNTAFWAINHKKHAISVYSDLGLYDGIISFGEGTTSYKIAEKIFAVRKNKEIRKNNYIQTAYDNDVLLEKLQKSSTRIGAISPEIVDVTSLITNYREKYSIDIALGELPEFSDLITTAIVTHHNFLENNQDFIISFLQAIERALRHTNMQIHEIEDRAISLFKDKANETIIKEALKLAFQSKVFPKSISIDYAQWENAAHLFLHNHHRDKYSREQKARLYYESFLVPYKQYSEIAIRRENSLIPPSKFSRQDILIGFSIYLTIPVVTFTFLRMIIPLSSQFTIFFISLLSLYFFCRFFNKKKFALTALFISTSLIMIVGSHFVLPFLITIFKTLFERIYLKYTDYISLSASIITLLLVFQSVIRKIFSQKNKSSTNGK